MLKIRAKAPLRLGIGGGGTDVSPYSDIYGGAVLNATINLYAHSFLEVLDGTQVRFSARDLNIDEAFDLNSATQDDCSLLLHRAVYKRVIRQFNDNKEIPIHLTTFCDAPAGSGLGSSSALVVSMLEVFRELLSLPLGEYDIARLAYEIEREDCGLAGGKQDQYAASFGGFNFIEFGANDVVVVNPLRVRRHIVNEFQASTILFSTGASRDSAKIINDQIGHIKSSSSSLDAMHDIKELAYGLKSSLLRGSISDVATRLRGAWEAKKATSKSISTPQIEEIEKSVIAAGATSIKVSGAGGGGFVMILVEPELRYKVIETLEKLPGKIVDFEFTSEGVMSWTK